jgi:serine/threonine protein kinase/Tol biopolymer transport system component
MSIPTGTRLGSYEILAALGAGGMGEVYRARDTKLDRDVAIKILSQAFAGDADRLSRFEREAKMLAALNHPHIAQIYGLESIGAGGRALILELVEGDDLSQRIARRPIPLDEALPIARQIADALEAAHEHGIIHRDLKPANVKVRADGTVKVLDFGLAKALDPSSGTSGEAMNSPTLTAHATQLGVILGTAAYMAPEQAKGKVVDKRADIWAFGVVLYEMLTGARAFTGEDVSDTLASVLKDTPSLDALPAATPPRLKQLLQRCLERDVKMRLRDIGEARVEIARILEGAADEVPTSAVISPTASRSSLVRSVPWILAAVSSVALITALLVWAPWRAATVSPPRRLLANIGAAAALPTDLGASAILSPDGTTLAFVAQQSNQTRLFIRKLDQLQAAILGGTDGAANPFFSPDGQSIAFFAGGKLKKIAVTGGAAVTLCDAPAGRGGTWADDNTIIFTPSAAANSTLPLTTLMRVSAAGGTPAVFSEAGKGLPVTHRWPQALPAGKGVVYTEQTNTSSNRDDVNVLVAPLSGGPHKVVARGAYYGRYVPTGHVIYMQQSTLFAAPFDLDRLETTGQAVPVVEGVLSNPVSGGAQVAVSGDGTLVYVPGVAATTASPIDWMTRDGQTSVLRAAKADWTSPSFSPDGQKLAVDISEGKQRNIWVYDWARETTTQLTFEQSQNRQPVWTPDGRRIVFSSDRAKPGVTNLYWVNADGTGEITRLTESSQDQVGTSWHPSGRFLVFMESRSATQWDFMILPMDGDAVRGWTPGKPTVFLSSPAIKVLPAFSPDGRWIAYVSNEAGGGPLDVYVRPFPERAGKWRISFGGGGFPRWSKPTRELLFYKSGRVMSASYDVVGDSFRPAAVQPWSPGTVRGVGLPYPYDIHPDGKRLAVVGIRDQETIVHDTVVFVFNFFDELRRLAPLKR